jgi:hypothetical protein
LNSILATCAAAILALMLSGCATAPSASQAPATATGADVHGEHQHVTMKLVVVELVSLSQDSVDWSRMQRSLASESTGHPHSDVQNVLAALSAVGSVVDAKNIELHTVIGSSAWVRHTTRVHYLQAQNGQGLNGSADATVATMVQQHTDLATGISITPRMASSDSLELEVHISAAVSAAPEKLIKSHNPSIKVGLRDPQPVLLGAIDMTERPRLAQARQPEPRHLVFVLRSIQVRA